MQLGPGRDQGELLVILPMFLYLKRDSQFFWEILWFHCSMGGCPNQLGERLLRLACLTDRYVRQPLIEFFVHIRHNAVQ